MALNVNEARADDHTAGVNDLARVRRRNTPWRGQGRNALTLQRHVAVLPRISTPINDASTANQDIEIAIAHRMPLPSFRTSAVVPRLFMIWTPLETERGKILPVTPRALFWCAHAGQHILFHDDPAAVSLLAQQLEHARKVNCAGAKFTEHALPDRGGVIPASGPRLGGNRRRAILEMNVPDTRGEAGETRCRLAATICEMAGVEAEADDVGVGQVQETGDLGRRLNPARAVRMEHGAQSGRVADGTRDPLRACGKVRPVRVGQRQLRRDPPGVLLARWLNTAIVGQDEYRRHGVGRRVYRGEQFGGAYGLVLTRPVRRLFSQADGHERADHRRAAPG